MVCSDVIKIWINDLLDKILTQCKKPHFEESLQVSGRYTNKRKSYGCSNFWKSPWWWARERPQPIFYTTLLLLPVTLFSFVQMASNSVQRHILWSNRPYQNLGQIDHNLHNHVFDDVICKPPIRKLGFQKSYANHQYENLDFKNLKYQKSPIRKLGFQKSESLKDPSFLQGVQKRFSLLNLNNYWAKRPVLSFWNTDIWVWLRLPFLIQHLF